MKLDKAKIKFLEYLKDQLDLKIKEEIANSLEQFINLFCVKVNDKNLECRADIFKKRFNTVNETDYYTSDLLVDLLGFEVYWTNRNGNAVKLIKNLGWKE